MVTSVTNRALLVQSGGFVGMGVPTVAVAVGGVAGVSVTAAVSDGIAAGGSVIETSAVAASGSVGVEAGSVADPPLQADRASASSAVTVNSFLTILSLLCDHVEPDGIRASVLEHCYLQIRFFQWIAGNLLLERFTRQHRQFHQCAQ
jgi:hypothetical protein